MDEYKQKVTDILEQHSDVAEAAAVIYNGPKRLALYVIEIGLFHIKARQRALNKRVLRSEIFPEVSASSSSIPLTKAFKQKVMANTQRLFGQDGWQIGEVNIKEFTKQDLLEEAERERRLAGGHIVNALIYEALAEPLNDDQTVKDYWTPAEIKRTKETIKGEGARP